MTSSIVIRPRPSATPSILEGELVTLLCMSSVTSEVIDIPFKVKVFYSLSKIRGGQGALTSLRKSKKYLR